MAPWAIHPHMTLIGRRCCDPGHTPPTLRGLVRRKSRVSGRPMSGHRHLRRASSEFLSAGGSLFYPFIGQMLRERYALPQEVPPDMRRLLMQLDKPRTGIPDVAATSAYGASRSRTTARRRNGRALICATECLPSPRSHRQEPGTSSTQLSGVGAWCMGLSLDPNKLASGPAPRIAAMGVVMALGS
jgi:hypothetical protein